MSNKSRNYKIYTYENPDADTWDKVALSDYVDEFQPYEISLAKEILTLFKKYKLENASLIETGSGSGHLAAYFAQNGYEVSLVDYSKEALRKSQLFFERLKLKAEFFHADITKLSKYVDKKYDVIFSSGVLEHFNDKDLSKILNESYKVSKGYLIFLVPNPRSLPYLLFRIKAMKNGDWLYGKEYLRENYEYFIKQAGFKLLGKEYLGMSFANGYIKYVFGESEGLKHFNDLVDFNLIPVEEAYLTAFIAVKE